MVIFDSTVPPYHGRAVYAVGEASELSGSDLDRALEAYPRPDGDDATPVMRSEVTAPAAYRLYQATASDMWVLCPREPRQPCPLHGLARDHRTLVTPALAGSAEKATAVSQGRSEAGSQSR
jgi:hypothetical protein